jgi:hypothetical protein
MREDELIQTNVSIEPDVITVTISGAAESGSFDQLASTFQEVHGKASAAPAARVVVDIRQLEFATSSCLKVLANWVIGASELDTPYRVEFRSNSKHAWQRRSLHALAAVAPGIVEVTTDR